MAELDGFAAASPANIGGSTSDAAEITIVGSKAAASAEEDISGTSCFDTVTTGAGACTRDQKDRSLLLLSNDLLARSAITYSYVASLSFILSHNRLVSF